MKFKLWNNYNEYIGIGDFGYIDVGDIDCGQVQYVMDLQDTDLRVNIDKDFFESLEFCEVGFGTSLEDDELILPIGFNPTIVKYIIRIF
jgi:hypothetical protein